MAQDVREGGDALLGLGAPQLLEDALAARLVQLRRAPHPVEQHPRLGPGDLEKRLHVGCEDATEFGFGLSPSAALAPLHELVLVFCLPLPPPQALPRRVRGCLPIELLALSDGCNGLPPRVAAEEAPCFAESRRLSARNGGRPQEPLLQQHPESTCRCCRLSAALLRILLQCSGDQPLSVTWGCGVPALVLAKLTLSQSGQDLHDSVGTAQQALLPRGLQELCERHAALPPVCCSGPAALLPESSGLPLEEPSAIGHRDSGEARISCKPRCPCLVLIEGLNFLLTEQRGEARKSGAHAAKGINSSLPVVPGVGGAGRGRRGAVGRRSSHTRPVHGQTGGR
mmetsp:Transcript_110692/g.346283  ORF Transcript_110692/g.346283 Transcript_110692/m.346283 type:complete len:340 (-) Transcript_110692:468-1487(-)